MPGVRPPCTRLCATAALLKHDDDIELALSYAFERLNGAMHLSDDEFDDRLSGTTAAVVYLRDGVCWCAHVGDVRAIIGQRVGAGHGRLEAIALTADHTPYRQDECDRVVGCGGHLASLEQLMPAAPASSSGGLWTRPDRACDLAQSEIGFRALPRVWMAQQPWPGCTFTRSLGDRLGESAGVSSVPEVGHHQLSAADRFVCVCSDGVWEFLTPQAVCDLIGTAGDPVDDPLGAARAVVAAAFRYWMQYDVRSDDITAVVVMIRELPFRAKAAAGVPMVRPPRRDMAATPSALPAATLQARPGARRLWSIQTKPVRRHASIAKLAALRGAMPRVDKALPAPFAEVEEMSSAGVPNGKVPSYGGRLDAPARLTRKNSTVTEYDGVDLEAALASEKTRKNSTVMEYDGVDLEAALASEQQQQQPAPTAEGSTAMPGERAAGRVADGSSKRRSRSPFSAWFHTSGSAPPP